MKGFKSFASAFALVLASASAASAATSGYSEFVESISWETGIGGPQILVTNESSSKLASQASFGIGQINFSIPVDASIRCKKDKDIDFHDAKVYFGPVGLNGLDSINETAALYSDDINITYQEWTGLLNGWLSESTPTENFTVPIRNIKSGHPTVRVDPVAEMEAELQKHLQNGGTAGDFLRNDQTVMITRPVSLAGACREGNNPKWGFLTKSINIFIHYEGDPSIVDAPKLNAQLGGNTPNGFNQQLPFKLETADFMANVPHHIGACPPQLDPMLRVTINGSGGVPGNVGVRIYEDGAGMIHEATVQLDPKNNGAPIDFAYPLKSRLQTSQAWNQVNKTFNHTLRVRARYQDHQGQWTSWSEMDSTVIKHRCTPQINVNLGNTNGGIGGYQQNGGDGQNAPQMQVQPQQLPQPPQPPSGGAATRVAPAVIEPVPATPTQIKPIQIEPAEKPARATN